MITSTAYMMPGLPRNRERINGLSGDMNDLHHFIVNYFSFEIRIKSRMPDIVFARNVFFFLSRHFLNSKPSTTAIGKFMKMDHSTVIYGCETLLRDIDQDGVKLYHFQAICLQLSIDYKSKLGELLA